MINKKKALERTVIVILVAVIIMVIIVIFLVGKVKPTLESGVDSASEVLNSWENQ